MFRKKYEIGNKEIIIPDELFTKEKQKIVVDFQLITKAPNSIIFNFQIALNFGITKAYCFLDEKSKELYDICYMEKNTKFYHADTKIELKEINSLEDESMFRIILINAPIEIIINDSLFQLKSFIPKVFFGLGYSYQIACFDFLNKAYATKIITKKDENQNAILASDFLKNKNKLELFFKSFKALIDQKEENIYKYKTLIENTYIDILDINFTQSKNYLENEFNDDIYYLIYLYMLFYVMNTVYCSKNNIGKAKINVNTFFYYASKFYEKYKNDEELLPYERIILFCSNILYFVSLDNVKKYNEANIRYMKTKNLKKNSILDYSFKFLNNFIEGLTSKSELYYPLLLLDCGIYHHDEGTIYGFDFQSSDTLKEHLRNLIPNVFFIYEEENLLDGERGFHYKNYNTIFLNKSLIFKDYKGDYFMDVVNGNNKEEIIKHYSMHVVKTLMHECFCLIKFRYKKEIGLISPKRFYNKSKHIITMKPKRIASQSQNPDDFGVNISVNSISGESGNFFEYFFGIFRGELVIDLIYSCASIGKLIDNVQYFTSDNIDILRNYIIYKYIITKKGIPFNQQHNSLLENDVKEMKSLIDCKYSNINSNMEVIKEENPKDFDLKNTEKFNQIEFIEDYPPKENKDYAYFVEKLKNSKTKEEARNYSYEVFKRLKIV